MEGKLIFLRVYLHGNLHSEMITWFCKQADTNQIQMYLYFLQPVNWKILSTNICWADSMCKTRHWCCVETRKMRCNSCPQGDYSLAGKIRLVPNSWLAGSYMVTTKRKVQSSWEFRDRWVGYQQKKKNKILWREKGTMVSIATIIMLHCTRCYHIHSHWVLRRTL